jgi:hypothetical protein
MGVGVIIDPDRCAEIALGPERSGCYPLIQAASSWRLLWMSLWLGCRAFRAAHFSLGSPLSGENFLGRNTRTPHPTGLFASLDAGLLVLDARIRNSLLSFRPASRLSVRGSRRHVHGVPMIVPDEHRVAGWLVELRRRPGVSESHAVAT